LPLWLTSAAMVPEVQAVTPAHDAPVPPPPLDVPPAPGRPPAPPAEGPLPPLLELLPAMPVELPATLELPLAPGLLPLPVPDPVPNVPPLADEPLRPPSALPLQAPSASRLPQHDQATTQREARNAEETIPTVLLPACTRVVHFLSR
jgi:hypothetical protein